jgi:hypothetical protein
MILPLLCSIFACDDGYIDLGNGDNGNPSDDADGDDGDTSDDEAGDGDADAGSDTDDSGDVATDDTGESPPEDTGEVPAEIDEDEDGFTISEGDCNDTDRTVYPGAPEACDDIDHDCDGMYTNDLLIRYDIDIAGVWTEPYFPSSHIYYEPHKTRELWYGYRDYDSDTASIGMWTAPYTGEIYPLVTELFDESGESVESRMRYRRTVDHQLLEVLSDNDADGVMDETATFSYSDDGILLTELLDSNGDGEIDRRWIYTLDELNRIIGWDEFYEPSGAPGYAETREYSDDGMTVTTTGEYDGIPVSTNTITYNEDGEIFHSVYDNDADGVTDSETTYDYNEAGQITEKFGFSPSWAWQSTYQYNDEGQLLRYAHDVGRDGTSENWENHIYEGDHLIQTTFGGSHEDGSEFPKYVHDYVRDDAGNWTQRTTTSSVPETESGEEFSTYNRDGRWTSWKGYSEDSTDLLGELITTCLGPPSESIVDSF